MHNEAVIQKDFYDKAKHYWPYNLAYDIFGGEREMLAKVYLHGIDVVIETLNEQEKNAILLRYQNGLTFEGIGEQLGVCGERARQIISKTMRKLRHPSRLNQLLAVSKAEFDSACYEKEVNRQKAEEWKMEYDKLEKLFVRCRVSPSSSAVSCDNAAN